MAVLAGNGVVCECLYWIVGKDVIVLIMNLSFNQAIDLHKCLRYIEACQEAIYGNDNMSDNIEVGDVSVTFHFDDGETFVDSLIVSGSECKKGRIDVEDYLRE